MGKKVAVIIASLILAVVVNWVNPLSETADAATYQAMTDPICC